MCELHAMLVVPISLVNLLHIYFVPTSEAALVNNVANYMLFLLFAFLCNGKWIYTSLSICLSSLGIILFYTLHENLKDA